MRPANPFKAPRLSHIPGPRGWKFISHMLHFQRDSLGALERSFREYGPVVSYPWPVSTVIVYDTTVIKKILIDRDQIYGKGSQTDQLRPVMGDGLVTNSDRPSWLRNRTVVSRELGARAIRAYAPIMEEFSREACRTLGAGSEIDITEFLRKLAFRIAGRVLLGANLTDDDSDMVDRAVLLTARLAHEHMFQLLPIPYFVPTPTNLEFKRHLKNLDRVVYKIIAEAKNTPVSEKMSIAARLVHARHPETGEALDDKTLRDEVTTLLIAGYETTSYSLTWILGLLAYHTDEQSAVRAECDGESPIDSMEFAKSHPRLYRAILEGMRMYTAIPMSSRKSFGTDEYLGKEIPPQTSVVIPVWVIHRHENFWKDPLVFRPSRFEGQDVSLMDNYIPFSKGARRCVGEPFSLVEMAIIIREVLRSFQLKLADSELPRPLSQASLKPAKPMRIRLEKRSCWRN